ncbi:hypothetical protein KUTeg_001371 [Tegillarca granosa]|uniref:Uncharacterized protein n=1 Tax=Tegillarca granosa TaxID=220873 RepID=A0ABQ9FR82_TEGGR|nr:hypothetical protein KUTeg_001371 [Tegillarca granosa]
MDKNLNDARKYNNIILIPGLGHYEINMVKALFKLLWGPQLKDLAKQFGFNSPRAVATRQSPSNHHKSWQILQIFTDAVSKVLIVSNCRQSLLKKRSPSLSENESFIISGNKSKGEGGDFIVEYINRKAKMLLSSGLPDEKKLLHVYRNIDRLDEIRRQMNDLICSGDEDGDYAYSYDLSE